MNETKCKICGKEVATEKLSEFDGKLICPECMINETTFCDHCGARIWVYEGQGNEAINLCQECFDSYYTHCTRCDQLIHRNDVIYDHNDDPYCQCCYSQHNDDIAIHDYYYKPEPIFYGKGSRYFGVELEVDVGGEYDYNADRILDIANNIDSLIYCKHDGSLDDGFEIVTYPMTLEYHQNSMPWNDVLNKLKEMHYLSHQAGTCGLHIHVNRNNFGEHAADRDACIARVLYFFEKHWEELLKFSRRSERQLQRWAARYGYKEHPNEILESIKKGNGNGRYTCINLENDSTVEFRMFRGTLNYNSLIATLQLVDRVCDVALYYTDEELKHISWTSFVSGCTEPELIRYLKERRIYVNEPVMCEEEV